MAPFEAVELAIDESPLIRHILSCPIATFVHAIPAQGTNHGQILAAATIKFDDRFVEMGTYLSEASLLAFRAAGCTECVPRKLDR